MTEGRGERATGTPNTVYDLSSVLFHALEGGASYDRYIRDAEEADDRELVGFFEQVRNEDSRRANEAQRLLAERTTTAVAATEDTTGAVEERHDTAAAPNTPVSGPGQREPDVSPVRPQEPPPPGTGVGER